VGTIVSLGSQVINRLMWLRSFSVITTLGSPNSVINLRKNRLASFAFRRVCTKTSSTSLFVSMVRHSQCFLLRIEITTSFMCRLSFGCARSRRIKSAKCCPKRFTYSRIASQLTITLRSANRSSTSAVLSAKRWHAQTPQAMISRGKWNPFSRGILVGMFMTCR